ncbi:hypothetical protein Smp_180890 [Schistosoma mansoni]|uniref:hypothetical protein n=1 Tax=Schistosoma mansoni TaxID=6183 RepID=UPI0001A62C6C|nr:hypothetical protein Smp_180890 [Schistosoma mansoni]|eukprot:XP_018649700.1 hypothetical protein Smp_180890 [Schistosoma mansoni]
MDNNNNQITNTLQLTIKDYAYRLRIGIKEDWKIKLFREYYPRRFHELCMIHLSFLIDIPWNFIDQKIHYHSNNNDHTLHSSNTITTNVCNTMKDNKSTLMNTTNIGGTTTKSRLKRLWNNWRINSHPVKSDYIPDELANNIITLIDCLDNDEACSVEGLFRKPGHNLRKRQIQEAVFETSFDPKVFQLNKYNFHDFASALKSVLVRLPTPLFTEHLLPLFLQVAEDAKNIDDSPPLRTAIRFATPTPTSIANFQVLDSSPIQFDDIMEISRTLKTKQQLKLENCIDQTPVLKWSRSVGEISSDYIQCSVEKSQHNDENLNITSVRSSNLSKISTNMNHLSPSKYPNYTNEQLEDICVDSVRRKFVKRRRFTELRLPSTINRTGGGGGGKSCHRRYLFSPCPPIPLLPFKRVGGEKRNFHISPLSTIKGTLTTNTALPSW